VPLVSDRLVEAHKRMSDKILVFIPCYNCAPQIERVLQQLKGPVCELFSEVLVLDNGSKDSTIETAVRAASNVEVEVVTIGRNVVNYNLGGSHKAAFAYALTHGFSHVLTLHGDDQGSIADIEPILREGLHRKYDACLGARFARGSHLSGYSRFRIFGNNMFNVLFSIGSRRRVLDLGSGLNVVAPIVFRDPSVLRYSDDLRFNVFLLLGLFDANRKVRFFPITWREDDQVSNVKLRSQALRTLTILRDYMFRRPYFRSADFRDAKHNEYVFEVVSRRDSPPSFSFPAEA